MTEQHPITPSPELVQQWRREWMVGNSDRDSYQNIATQAARWGADHELGACCEWLDDDDDRATLRAARRPKPPSLKEQALKVLPAHTPGLSTRVTLHPDDIALVRRALEQLDD